MKKIAILDKVQVLDFYIEHPANVNHPEVLQAIKADVVKSSTPGTRKASEINNGNQLYNEAMGVYRRFLEGRDSHLKLEGRKAKQYKEAMLNILHFIRSFQKKGEMPNDDQHVLAGLTFMFKYWDNLNHYHKNRLGLPQIYDSIEEIIPMIKNGYDAKSTNKSKLDQLEQSLRK